MQRLSTILSLSALAMLAACNNQTDRGGDETGAPDAGETQGLTPDPEAPVSIIRPDVEQPDVPDAQPEPLEATIGFPEGGSDLDAPASVALAEVIKSTQNAAGGPIVLRAHSDAGGSDAANMRASQRRGEKVRDWLIENGVDAGRITVIAFGEQNPIEPNALPNGEPNEAGRAANRRVDVEVGAVVAKPAKSGATDDTDN